MHTVHQLGVLIADVMAPTASELQQAAEAILLAALPEFLGSLAAALVIAAATWAARRLRRRHATPLDCDSDGDTVIPLTPEKEISGPAWRAQRR